MQYGSGDDEVREESKENVSGVPELWLYGNQRNQRYLALFSAASAIPRMSADILG